MTLQEFQDWALAGFAVIIGGLATVIRAGDVRRLDRIEQRQDEQEKGTRDDVTKLHDKIDALRNDIHKQHVELLSRLPRE